MATVGTCVDDEDTELITGVTTDVLQRATDITGSGVEDDVDTG